MSRPARALDSPALSVLDALAAEADVLRVAERDCARDLLASQGHALYSPRPGVVVEVHTLSEWDAATGWRPRHR